MLIIDGMDMPANCASCKLNYDYMCCSVTSTHMDYDKMDNGRLTDCPIKAELSEEYLEEKFKCFKDWFLNEVKQNDKG